MKTKNRGRATLAAALFGAIAIFAFAAQLRAQDPSPLNAPTSTAQALWVADDFVFMEVVGTSVPLLFGSLNSQPGGVTFDSNQNFWGTFCVGGKDNDGLVFELTRSQLLKIKSGQTANAKVAFGNVSFLFDCPSALHFDSSGNLWVANSGHTFGTPSIMKYSPDQLATGGNVTPDAVFMLTDVGAASDMNFDASGNLWIADNENISGVFEFDADQLSASGTQAITPNLQMTSTATFTPQTIVFDQNGNLWVGRDHSPLLLFAASDLVGAGTISPVPLATIQPAKIDGFSTFPFPSGLAIDGHGNLWIASSNGGHKMRGSIAKFKAAKISTSGTPNPSLFLLTTQITQHPTLMTIGPQL